MEIRDVKLAASAAARLISLFDPSSYRRTDKEPDYERDLPLVEDAIVCIADAVAKAGKEWVNRRRRA
jgi:hypothetical protein